MQQLIPDDEWQDILFSLLEHHSLFYKIGEMGKPYLTDTIDTACVTFSPDGEFINFLFGIEFWASCDKYKKLFVICHESLHLILNHGKRFKDAKNKELANVAMDVVVNHSLVNRFGFVRENIQDHEEYCWVDTVFPQKKEYGMEIGQDETSEYYFNLLNKNKDSNNKSYKLVDLHEFFEGKEGPLFDKLNAELSDEERNTIKKFFEKHSDKGVGKGEGGILHFAAKEKVAVKKKWESVIQRWTHNKLKDTEKVHEQWARKNRRFSILDNSMFLPTDMEIEEMDFAEDKISIYFYLDTSGSCWHLKDRFFNAAESLPKRKFDVRLFCFDTKVYETDLKSRRVYGSGGTNFDILESNIIKLMNKDNSKYPSAVWVMTDGHGTPVQPKIPVNWYWFLVKGGTKSCIPKESKIYSLDDFV